MNQFPPLPEEYTTKMQSWLGNEFTAFLNSYSTTARKGLRVNLLKIQTHTLKQELHFLEEPVPWCKEGYYISRSSKAGNHPYHQAGLYYLQEPSAMAVVSALDPRPGEWILDLCAAPGGKSTQIAARLGGQGLLWSNEPSATRLKVLAENIERLGVGNCIISNELPAKLAQKLPQVFDKIVVDAPCSGEGMFRKNPSLRAQWTWRGVEFCAERQKEILSAAVTMLKPGGTLVYSTCTFNPIENEGVIDWLLTHFPDLSLLSHPDPLPVFDGGHPEWLLSNNRDLEKCTRLWPHKLEGEGHFIALLRKTETGISSKIQRANVNITNSALKTWQAFAKDFLDSCPEGFYFERNQHLFWLPLQPPDFNGLKILRPGLLLGAFKKNRFEPAHSAALAWPLIKTINNVDFGPDDQQLFQYFAGHPLPASGNKGWLTITVNGFPVGWGKDDGHLIKNHYPKGLR